LKILGDRYDNRQNSISSQLKIDNWNKSIGAPTLADTILDRLINNDRMLNLSCDLIRMSKIGLTKPENQE